MLILTIEQLNKMINFNIAYYIGHDNYKFIDI